jgi:putative DNA primase/helicase
MMPSSSLRDALGYAEKGWRIFPTKLVHQPNGKITKQPAIKDWPNACSCDPGQIRKWWRQWPDAVISIVTGPRNGIIVLDVDVGIDKGGRAYTGFDALEEVLRWWAVPPVPCVHTRGGGCHFYFSCERLPDGEILDRDHPAHNTAILNSASELAPHVDIRGWNGQAVLPSSNSGYWLDPHLTFDLPMPPAPAWFNHRPQKRRSASSGTSRHLDPGAVLAESCRIIRHAPEGTRHDTYRHEVFRVARLVGLGLLDERNARHELQTEIMALGIVADGHTRRVDKYFAASWDEGFAAAGTPRGRR